MGTTQEDIFDLQPDDAYLSFVHQNTTEIRGYGPANFSGSVLAFTTVGHACDKPLNNLPEGHNSFRTAMQLDVMSVNTYDYSNRLSHMAAFVSDIQPPKVDMSRASAALCFN